MPVEMAQSNLETFARDVMPELKQLGHRPVFDMEEDDAPAFMAAE
jgi:hypothetical protein